MVRMHHTPYVLCEMVKKKCTCAYVKIRPRSFKSRPTCRHAVTLIAARFETLSVAEWREPAVALEHRLISENAYTSITHSLDKQCYHILQE